MALSMLAGCGATNKDTESTQPKEEPKKEEVKQEETKEKVVRLGLSLPTQMAERWVRDKENIEAYCKKLGIDLKVQVSNNDAAKQDAQCENLLSQGIDILIVAPHDAKGAAAIVEKAHKANVKVISYDRLIMDSDLDLYISFDNVKVGELQGKYLTEKVPKGNIIVMRGAPSDNNATLFYQGAMKYIKPLADKGDLKIIADQAIDDWQPANAMKILENALTKSNNDVQGILSPADLISGTCDEALAAQKMSGKVVVTGQDADLAAAQRIIKGTQSMTVFKDTRKLGVAAVDAAVKMAKGEEPGVNNKVNNNKIDVPSILLTPISVDKSNLDKELIDSGYLKKEDVYK